MCRKDLHLYGFLICTRRRSILTDDDVEMEKAYWEARHRKGCASGSVCDDWNWKEGICELANCVRKGPDGECIISLGFQRKWKWKIIGEVIRKYSPELLKSHLHSSPSPRAPVLLYAGMKVTNAVSASRPPSGPILSKVIDVGCGDLSFWDAESLRLVDPLSWHTHGIILTEEYIGIDISDAVIIRNRRLSVKGWSFIASSSHILNQGLRAPAVFCIDLLFHIMDDTTFIETLKNLCHYSEDLIFIHTWKHNPFKGSTSDGVYQKYRPLEAYFGIFVRSGFTLIEERLNPNRIGCLYIFKRRDGRAA